MKILVTWSGTSKVRVYYVASNQDDSHFWEGLGYSQHNLRQRLAISPELRVDCVTEDC